MTLAIDFGTSNTVVTRWNGVTQQPEVLTLGALSWQLGDQPPLVPSLVYVEDAATATVTVGQPVRDRGFTSASNRYFKQFKRGIGSTVQGFMPVLDGQTLSFEALGQWFLTAVIDQARQQDPELNSLIFTVPVDSFEIYRHWLAEVCQSLAIEQVRLLDEPTAAALGYGLQGGETVLVVDFGGGTLDFSLVQLTGSPARQPLGFVLKWGQTPLQSSQRVQTAQVLAKAGETLGGADIDNWLADYFAETQQLPMTPLTLRLIERLKIRLSSAATAQESYFDDDTLDSYDLKLKRSALDDLLRQRGLFERLDKRLDQVLQQARRQGIGPDNIDAVLMVGGSAQIPAVQAWLKGRFDPTKIKLDQPFTAVAKGALQLQQGLQLKDFLYHSYGIRYWDRRQNRHGWQAVIPAGQPYPMADPIELLLGASVDQQPSLELVLGELSEGDTATEIFFENGQLVTRQRRGEQTVKPLNDTDSARTIATLTPPGFPGSDRVRVSFRVDDGRFLRLTVDDLLTGETLMDNAAIVQLS
ncbi:MAG: Hsp70 family protein [Cyanobacteria bacterium P01_A01_bin.105]